MWTRRPTQGGESAAKVNMEGAESGCPRQDEALPSPSDTLSGPRAGRVALFPVSLPGGEGLPSPMWVSATHPWNRVDLLAAPESSGSLKNEEPGGPAHMDQSVCCFPPHQTTLSLPWAQPPPTQCHCFLLTSLGPAPHTVAKEPLKNIIAGTPLPSLNHPGFSSPTDSDPSSCHTLQGLSHPSPHQFLISFTLSFSSLTVHMDTAHHFCLSFPHFLLMPHVPAQLPPLQSEAIAEHPICPAPHIQDCSAWVTLQNDLIQPSLAYSFSVS